MLGSFFGQRHCHRLAVYRAARLDGSAVVIQQRLEAEADAEKRDLAEHVIDELHHAAGIARVAGAWGQADDVRLCGQNLLDGDGVAEDGGLVASECVHEVVDKGVVVINEHHVRGMGHRTTSNWALCARAMACRTA